ncbi:hypothetical protein MKW98_004090, partial [Papaver atlanticum]
MGLDKQEKESNEGKKEKKGKGNTSGNNGKPLEEQQMGIVTDQNRGFDLNDVTTNSRSNSTSTKKYWRN